MARVAMPVGAGFEDSEFTVAYDRLREAGKDQEVVEDGNFITSRKPEDMDALCSAILERM